MSPRVPARFNVPLYEGHPMQADPTPDIKALYTGRLERGPTGSLAHGWMEDRDGWRLVLSAAADKSGYALTHLIDGAPHYTGRLEKHGSRIIGWLIDPWGWRIDIAAEPDDGALQLTGRLGKIPDALRIPAIDDELASQLAVNQAFGV